MVEAITFFFVVLGGIFAFLAYNKSNVIEPQEAKIHLIAKFNSAKDLNAELMDLLKNYAINYNAFDEVFMQGLTFSQCINMLKEARDNVLNQENQKTITDYKGSQKFITDMTKTVENLNTNLVQCLTTFNLYFAKKY